MARKMGVPVTPVAHAGRCIRRLCTFKFSGRFHDRGTTTYIFKENGVVTIRSDTGSQVTTYGFVKSGNNEIVFNIPAHADGVTKYTL